MQASRRTKWHPWPPPPPGPKIIHFPLNRRICRKPPNPTTAAHSHRRNPLILHFSSRGNLEKPPDQENEPYLTFFCSELENSVVQRREKVEGERVACGGAINEFEEDKRMFQAEVLRADCNLLRVETEIDLNKLERNRIKTEKTLRSAVHPLAAGTILQEGNRCSGLCKAIVRKIIEQVRAEIDQWSQMQEMLGQVGSEMQQLRASRDFWESRACGSDYEIQSLKHDVEEWRDKARGYKIKADKLQHELSALQGKLQKLKARLNLGQNQTMKLISYPPRKQLENQEHALSYQMGKQYSREKMCNFKFVNHKKELIIEGNRTRKPAKDLSSSISMVKRFEKDKRTNIRRRSKEKRDHVSERVCMQEEDLLFNNGRRKL